MQLGSRHTDFGHSIKALWMLYLSARVTGDTELEAFASTHAARLLARAAQPSGCWASGMDADGTVYGGSDWWTSAELSQAAATLALAEPMPAAITRAEPMPAAVTRAEPGSLARYLGPSYACWFERFVDRAGGEVWPFVPPEWTPEIFRDRQPAKIFHWKSGYHSMEHALVALITTAGLQQQPLALYYAFRQVPPAERIQPYLFTGTIATTDAVELREMAGLRGQRVTFRDIR